MTVTSKRLLEAVWRDAIVIVIAVPLVVASVILYASTEPHPSLLAATLLLAQPGVANGIACRRVEHRTRER